MILSINYCPKCGRIVWIELGAIETCDYCGTLLLDTGKTMTMDEVAHMGNKQKQEFESLKQSIFEQYCLTSPQFDQAALEKRKAMQAGERNKAFNPPPAPKPKPRCPTCGSTNVRRVDGLERAASILSIGLFSKKINKSYLCKDCKATW